MFVNVCSIEWSLDDNFQYWELREAGESLSFHISWLLDIKKVSKKKSGRFCVNAGNSYKGTQEDWKAL